MADGGTEQGADQVVQPPPEDSEDGAAGQNESAHRYADRAQQAPQQNKSRCRPPGSAQDLQPRQEVLAVDEVAHRRPPEERQACPQDRDQQREPQRRSQQ